MSSNIITWVRNDEIMVSQEGGGFVDVALNLASISPEHEPKIRVTSVVISNKEQEWNGFFLTVGAGNPEICQRVCSLSSVGHLSGRWRNSL